MLPLTLAVKVWWVAQGCMSAMSPMVSPVLFSNTAWVEDDGATRGPCVRRRGAANGDSGAYSQLT